MRIRFTSQTFLERLVARDYYVSGDPDHMPFVAPRPLTGRVEGWRGAHSPFPAPATSNAACGFPALRLLC